VGIQLCRFYMRGDERPCAVRRTSVWYPSRENKVIGAAARLRARTVSRRADEKLHLLGAVRLGYAVAQLLRYTNHGR